jgi:tetratricopeptide (TPR) repeat protein
VESLADMYLCLAAKEILNMFDSKYADGNRSGNVLELTRKCNEFFVLADETVKLYSLSFLLKGFYYLVLGDIVRAEESFTSVSKRISSGQDNSKKKYLCLSFIGWVWSMLCSFFYFFVPYCAMLLLYAHYFFTHTKLVQILYCLQGMVHYASGRYMQAAEWFSKALIANPHCGPSLRTSIGLCYYKLQQFERASQSSLRAISLESMDSTALILMGLVDLSEADKSHPKRKDLRRSAFDCFSLANRLDPTNPVIWNLLANQY